ncbi:hypothetical protein BKI52_42330 [marine bacterium AO1-C]|nr:hypothetical protein BKI52_42330 [marine bacterium AO1-C]
MEWNDDHNESFNPEFCHALETAMVAAFTFTRNPTVKGFWSDGGISYRPKTDYMISKKSVNDTRKIETYAEFGKNGEGDYYIIIHFGKYSLRRYARGTSLIDCIPDPTKCDEWIKVDLKTQTIEVWLK